MGATVIVRTTKYCDRESLKRWVSDQSSQDACEHGSSYSGYWNMCSGLDIHEATVFKDEKSASEFLDTKMQKWSALVAVPFMQEHEVSPEVTTTDEKWKELRAKELALVNQLSSFPNSVLAKSKAAKSAFKTCTHCKSKISVQHLSGVGCPVCRENLLFSASDDTKLKTLREKVDLARKRREDRREFLNIRARKDNPPVKLWLVGGICAC